MPDIGDIDEDTCRLCAEDLDEDEGWHYSSYGFPVCNECWEDGMWDNDR